MLAVLDRFVDPLSLLIVVGGTVLVTIMSSTREDLGRAVRALGPFFVANPWKDGQVADRAVRRIQRVSEYKGIVFADRVNTPVEFVHRAACRLADAERSDVFAAWAREEVAERRVRHAGAVGVWRRAAELAPSMGMIGTVIGLIAMFAQMSDPSTMGPALALTMLTTLYGLILAAVATGPVATRLERLSEAECQWQSRAVERLIELAQTEEAAIERWRERKVRQAG